MNYVAPLMVSTRQLTMGGIGSNFCDVAVNAEAIVNVAVLANAFVYANAVIASNVSFVIWVAVSLAAVIISVVFIRVRTPISNPGSDHALTNQMLAAQ